MWIAARIKKQMPMRLNVHFVFCCIFTLVCSSAFAQQRLFSVVDTTYVPVLPESQEFHNYNFVYKSRLDSITKTVPLSYNEHVQKYIDIYTERKDMMGKMLGISNYYFPIFEKALKSLNIPEEIKYLPIIESSMNPHAVSRVGATGLWQFMFTTAKGYGLNMDNFEDQRKDPIQASYAAAAYFKDAYQELGDWLLAIAAYNCGVGNVNRAIAKADSRDFWEIRRFLPLETRNYVPAFIAAVYVMNYSGNHQIKMQKAEWVKNTDTIHVNHFVTIASVAEALNMEEAALCELNPSYKRKIINGTELSPKRVILPKVSLADFSKLYAVLNESTMDINKNIILAANDDRRVKKKPSVESRPAFMYHKVIPGQNLSTIADKYHVEVQDLKVWNKLKGSTIVPGQKLKIYNNTTTTKHSSGSTRG